MSDKKEQDLEGAISTTEQRGVLVLTVALRFCVLVQIQGYS